MDYKKISVLIVTYKQADVIGRNLDSILQQKEYGLHEIVICDDCSPDNNWEVIQRYVEEYPGIIRAYRNSSNMGIYGNSDKCASLHGDADLFCWLEGDDALELGVFKGVQDFVLKNQIDVNGKVGIFCDYSSVDPYGKKVTHPNNLIQTGYNPFSLYLRGLSSWRASFFSRRIIEQFKPSILDKGVALAELMFDSQWFLNMDTAYYCPILGSLYYTGIGVSVNLGYGSPFKKEQAIIKWKYFLDNKIYVDKKDKFWLLFKIHQAKYFVHPTVADFTKSIVYFVKGKYPQSKCRVYLAPLVKRIFRRK